MPTIASTPAPHRYDPLPPDVLAAALRELPGWHGDTRRIARTVEPDDMWTLLERVAAAEADLDHHTVVDLDAGTVTFAVWTHVCDAVTAADLELARRIDAVVDGA
ncbi:MAG TPA: 4a-hydroxytetrahydrobiopterin dehydratase [Mycobacteriales bacterium]|nr:4a-hydroxytetrahydrobiopterin dehydratase [Mycobacteriales bacterium]